LGAFILTSSKPLGLTWDFNAKFAAKLPAFMVWNEELYLPWQMIIYLSAGFIVLVVVSLFTKRVPSERLDRFYACLRTPIMPGEPETQPFTLPAGVEPAPRNPLISHPDFEIPKPTIIGVGGFLAAWAGVALLIGAVYWIIG
jgi:hypothetical protein